MGVPSGLGLGSLGPPAAPVLAVLLQSLTGVGLGSSPPVTSYSLECMPNDPSLFCRLLSNELGSASSLCLGCSSFWNSLSALLLMNFFSRSQLEPCRGLLGPPSRVTVPRRPVLHHATSPAFTTLSLPPSTSPIGRAWHVSQSPECAQPSAAAPHRVTRGYITVYRGKSQGSGHPSLKNSTTLCPGLFYWAAIRCPPEYLRQMVC